MNLLKSVLHNLGVVIVGFAFGYLGAGLDRLLHFAGFGAPLWVAVGSVLLSLGFLTRVWATLLMYERKMRVIVLAPQSHLITTGPYRFSRNPLYLGGNVFIFLGAVLMLGSPSGIALTALNVVAVDLMIRREERQLAAKFGDEWRRYTMQTRRWL